MLICSQSSEYMKTGLKINITELKVKLCFDPLPQKEEEHVVLVMLNEHN